MRIKKLAYVLALGMVANPVWADRDHIGGSPRADFQANELVIPCVQLRNFEDDLKLEGRYFDVRMKRLENSLDSFDYRLTEATLEDSDVCRRTAALAAFEDDDFDNSDDDRSDNDDDGFKRADPPVGGKPVRLVVDCEVDDDGDGDEQSEVKLKVSNLVPGNYRARVTSGGVNADSLEKPASRFKTEFKFKSDTDDKDNTPIAVDFIKGGRVTGAILDANNNDQVIISANAVCRIEE